MLMQILKSIIIEMKVIYSEQTISLFEVQKTMGYDTNTDDLANI